MESVKQDGSAAIGKGVFCFAKKKRRTARERKAPSQPFANPGDGRPDTAQPPPFAKSPWPRWLAAPEKRLFWLGMLLGAASFLLIYGADVLDFTFDAWLLQSGDLKQHYVGWKGFRASPWRFPIGLGDRLSYPVAASVIYSDSIPLFAVLFKLLSPLLPQTFQYFGLWGIMCYALQGAISAVLVYKFCRSAVFSIIGSLFFIFSVPFYQRMFGHTSLAGHFVLLLGLYLWFFTDWRKWRKQLVLWGLLGALCASVHLYFVPMAGVLLCGCVLERWLRDKNWRHLLLIAVYLGSALVTIFLLGGFSTQKSMINGNMGLFNANLNGLVNNQGVYRLLPALPQFSVQGEGLCYLGVGMLLLCVCVLGSLFIGKIINRGTRKKDRRACPVRRVAVWAAGVVLYVIALGPVITLGESRIAEPWYPDFVLNIWLTFRATGRFMWPVMYLIFLWAFYETSRRFSKKIALCLLLVAGTLQFVDVMSVHLQRVHFDKETATSATVLTSGSWQSLSGYSHLSLLLWPDTELGYDFANYALDCGMTVNLFPFAHEAVNMNGQIGRDAQAVLSGQAHEDTLYVLRTEEIPAGWEELLLLTQMDDAFTVGTARPQG